MKFFKENSYLISRIFVMHLGMMIFGLVLATACSEQRWLLVLSGVFSTCFYMCLLYVTTWEHGAKDIIRVEAGRAEARPYLGFKTAAVAALPEAVMVLLLLIGYLSGYAFASTDFGIGLFGVMRIILGFWQAPYLGLVNAFLVSPNAAKEILGYTAFGAAVSQSTFYLITVLIYIILLLPSVAASGIGYISGTKNFRIFGFASKPPKQKK